MKGIFAIINRSRRYDKYQSQLDINKLNISNCVALIVLGKATFKLLGHHKMLSVCVPPTPMICFLLKTFLLDVRKTSPNPYKLIYLEFHFFAYLIVIFHSLARWAEILCYQKLVTLDYISLIRHKKTLLTKNQLTLQIS